MLPFDQKKTIVKSLFCMVTSPIQNADTVCIVHCIYTVVLSGTSPKQNDSGLQNDELKV